MSVRIFGDIRICPGEETKRATGFFAYAVYLNSDIQ